MKQIPFLLKLLRGGMGTSFVVKHYRYGVVLARYPDMSRVRPTTKQRA